MSTIATFPLGEFSLPSGGVILKSSDGVEFKVNKNILSLASSLFCQMFTLPQSEDSGDSETSALCASESFDVQLIPVSESSTSLDMLLRLIRPIEPPVLPGMSETGHVTDAKALIDAVEPVLAAALKYEMPVIVRNLSSKLLVAAEMTLPDGNLVNDTLALRVHILACRFKLKEEAHRAAHAALKGRVYDVFFEELRYINAAHYFRFIEFHNAVVIRIRGLVRPGNVPKPYSKYGCDVCDMSWRTKEWNQFVKHALPILEESPRNSKVFSLAYAKEISNTDTFNNCLCAGREAWHTACRRVQEIIELEISRNDIDLSEI